MRDQMDYLSGDDGDLLIINHDWSVGESTYAHQRNLIKGGNGDYKANPTICVDIDSFQDGEDKGAPIRAITAKFLQDGMEVIDLSPNPNAISDNTARVFNNAFYP